MHCGRDSISMLLLQSLTFNYIILFSRIYFAIVACCEKCILYSVTQFYYKQEHLGYAAIPPHTLGLKIPSVTALY